MENLQSDSSYFIYILECSNGAYYTGYTTDIERRYEEHLNGSAKCKFTRSFPPVAIAACWQFEGDVSIALKIERKIKALSKTQKYNLISAPETINKLFDFCHVCVSNF